ncbi:hypothetical protein ACERII_19635 [Evansella sp. AB-rgal1]|uniref:YfjL-like protein n=1 Tax=Evansella sp. AB-rgal1 TaxID=3242696 RepID=UPI00359D1B4A
MKVKKWIYSILIVVLSTIVLVLYTGFNGNPISKFIAEKSLSNHLEETYPDREFRIKEGFHNFKISGYEFNVVEIGSGIEFDFTMNGDFIPRLGLDGVRQSQLDRRLMERLSDEAEEEMTTLLADEINTLKRIDVNVEVLKGQLPNDVVWDKDLPFDNQLTIYILLDLSDLKKEEFFHIAQNVQEKLNKEGYDYERVIIDGNVFENEQDDYGYVKYALGFHKTEKLKEKDIKEF